MNIRQNIPAGITRQQQTILTEAYDFAETLNGEVEHEVIESFISENHALLVKVENDDWTCLAVYGPKGGVKYAFIRYTRSCYKLSNAKAKLFMRGLRFLRNEARYLEKYLQKGAA